MTVKAIYEDGVFKPKEPVALDERTEVELEVRTPAPPARGEADPRGFVGFIKNAPEDVPLAQHHDLYLDMEQYGHMTYYLRPLMAAPDWGGLGRDEKLRRFIAACKQARPELVELWEGMDRHPDMWSDALEHCMRVIQRGAAAAAARR